MANSDLPPYKMYWYGCYIQTLLYSLWCLWTGSLFLPPEFRGVFRTESDISKMERLTKAVNAQLPLTILAKSFILDVWWGSEYASLIQENLFRFAKDTALLYLSLINVEIDCFSPLLPLFQWCRALHEIENLFAEAWQGAEFWIRRNLCIRYNIWKFTLKIPGICTLIKI